MRRRRHARENPKTSTGVYVALGAGALLLGVGVYLLSRPASAATSSGGSSGGSGGNALPAGTNVTNVTLHVGQRLGVTPPPVPAATADQIAAGAQNNWASTTIVDTETDGTPVTGAPIFNGDIAARPGTRQIAYVASNRYGLMSGPWFYINATVVP
jgi:hypothetical protein